MSDKNAIEELSNECRSAQLRCARDLRDIAEFMRKQQRDINIAKVTFSLASLVGYAMSLAGHLGLGRATEKVSTVAQKYTDIAESVVTDRRIEEAQKALDDLSGTTETLLHQLRHLVEKAGVPWTQFLWRLGIQGGGVLMDFRDLVANMHTAVKICEATIEAVKIMASIAGLAPSTFVSSKEIEAECSIGVVLSLKDIIENSINIHNNVSTVADEFERAAARLEASQ